MATTATTRKSTTRKSTTVKATTGRQSATATVENWVDVDKLVTMATGSNTIAMEQIKLAEQAQLAADNARALRARSVWLIAAHPEGKGKPLNASYAARMTGFPRTTVNDIIKAGQNSVDKHAFDMSDMLAPVSDKERETVNKFYADGIAAKRREERAKAKAAKAATATTGEGKPEGDDQSSAGKPDGITGTLVVDGLKLAANRVAELKRSKVTLSKKEMTEAAAYVARMVAWIEESQADAAAAASE